MGRTKRWEGQSDWRLERGGQRERARASESNSGSDDVSAGGFGRKPRRPKRVERHAEASVQRVMGRGCIGRRIWLGGELEPTRGAGSVGDCAILRKERQPVRSGRRRQQAAAGLERSWPQRHADMGGARTVKRARNNGAWAGSAALPCVKSDRRDGGEGGEGGPLRAVIGAARRDVQRPRFCPRARAGSGNARLASRRGSRRYRPHASVAPSLTIDASEHVRRGQADGQAGGRGSSTERGATHHPLPIHPLPIPLTHHHPLPTPSPSSSSASASSSSSSYCIRTSPPPPPPPKTRRSPDAACMHWAGLV
jgi:hypothetical protein